MINGALGGALDAAVKGIPALGRRKAEADYAKADRLAAEAAGTPFVAKEHPRNMKSLGMALLAAFGSRMLDKSGEMGKGILARYMQDQEAKSAQDLEEQRRQWEAEQRAKMVQAEALKARAGRGERVIERFEDMGLRREAMGAKSDYQQLVGEQKAQTERDRLVSVLTGDLGGSRGKLAASMAYSRLQSMAADDPEIAAILPDQKTFQNSLSVRAFNDIKNLRSEYTNEAGLYGAIDDPEKVAYLESRRRQIADAWFDGDIAKVPPVPTEKTLAAAKFDQVKVAFAENLKRWGLDRSDRLAKYAGEAARAAERLAIARGQLAISGAHLDVSQANLALRREEIALARSNKGFRSEAEKEIERLSKERAGYAAVVDGRRGDFKAVQEAKTKLASIDGEIRFLREQQAAHAVEDVGSVGGSRQAYYGSQDMRQGSGSVPSLAELNRQYQAALAAGVPRSAADQRLIELKRQFGYLPPARSK